MDTNELIRMRSVEAHHWWYQGLDRFLLSQWGDMVTNPRILDLGCGTGRLLQTFKANPTSIGVDVSDALAQTFPSAHGTFVQSDFWSFIANLPETEKFDLILSIDSLYFLEEDLQKRLLEKLSIHLNQRGSLFLHLPAGAAFARNHDRKVGINSRYNKQKIFSIFPKTMEIQNIRHRMFLLSPLVFLVALVDRLGIRKEDATDLKVPSPLLNRFFYWLLRLDDAFLAWAPFGTSVFLKGTSIFFRDAPRKPQEPFPPSK